MESHLLQMRGLKLYIPCWILRLRMVASFTDAWIETEYEPLGMRTIIVASFTDAWIETSGSRKQENVFWSHLLQMRGLKRRTSYVRLIANIESHLLQMRGLKQRRQYRSFRLSGSHLLQMRGLKPRLCRGVISVLGRIFYRCVD